MLMWVIFVAALINPLVVEMNASKFILNPRTSKYCKDLIVYGLGGSRLYVVQHQAMVQTSVESENITNLYDGSIRVCEPAFLPFGQLVSYKSDTGGINQYWFLRMKIEGYFSDCKSRLIVTERALTKRNAIDHKKKPIIHVFHCNSKLPHIFEAFHRRVDLTWDFNGTTSESSVTVYISRYVQFLKENGTESRREQCVKDPIFGHFCNTSEICIPHKTTCDFLDDCFTDDSDEFNCPKKSNDSSWIPRSEHGHGWITNLPWIALGIVPIILIFALARICSQKRPLDIDEDYKMGFNTEDEEDGEEGVNAGAGGVRSERSCSPDAESTRSGAQADYDEGYSLPRHKKTMSASSDYLPANFAELTASPANRRRPENDRAIGHQFGAGTPTKPDVTMPPAQPQQQHVVAVQINNPVYGNNVYVDVPTQAALKDENYTRPSKQVVFVAPVPKSERSRNGQEEYTPLLPPLPSEAEAGIPDKPIPPYSTSAEIPIQRLSSSGTNDDYEEDMQPSSYDDDLMTPPPPSCQGMRSLTGDRDRPEMLHLKPLLRPGGSNASSPRTPIAPNGNAAPEHNNRDSDYDKNYIVV